MPGRPTVAIVHLHRVAVTHALCNHEPVDAISGEVLHVTVQEAGTLAVQHALAVADDGADGGASAGERGAADAGGQRPQVGVALSVGRARVELVGGRELVDGDAVLVGVAGPGTVHEAVGFVLFVLGQHLERTGVEFRVLATRVERGHAANGQQAALMTNLRHQLAQVLEEGEIVRDGVAVGQNPGGVVQVEVDEAGHVVPAAEVQTEQVVAQVVGELFHLEGEWV